jgi:arginase
MNSRVVLSPFFLDQPLPALQGLFQRDWTINNPSLPSGNERDRISAVLGSLADLVAETVAVGARPISVAGDCCTAIAVSAGLQRAGMHPFLIWFDAHGDFNTWETSPSGFIGGMPLAMLVGRGEQRLCETVGLKPVAERDVMLTDARDLDPAEADALRTSKVTVLHHASEVLTFPLSDRLLHIHVDTDIIDPAEAPAQNYPAPGGPSAAELRTVFECLARTNRIAAVSVSTWNPALDKDGRTASVCMDLLGVLVEGW